MTKPLSAREGADIFLKAIAVDKQPDLIDLAAAVAYSYSNAAAYINEELRKRLEHRLARLGYDKPKRTLMSEGWR